MDDRVCVSCNRVRARVFGWYQRRTLSGVYERYARYQCNACHVLYGKLVAQSTRPDHIDSYGPWENAWLGYKV